MAYSIDKARVLTERDEVLSRPEFRHHKGFFEVYVLPVLRDVQLWFDSLPRPVYWVLLAAMFLIVAALMAHVIATITRQSRGAEPTSRASGARAGARAPTGDLAAEARGALADGRFVEVVRLAWLAALARLDVAGVSEARAERADYEHLSAVRRRAPAVAPTVEALAALFARARWGGMGVGAVEAERSLQLVDAVTRELPR